MTSEEKAAIRAMCEAATPGPWVDNGPDHCGKIRVHTVSHDNGYVMASAHFICSAGDEVRQSISDADFVRHSRTDVPALLDALEAAEGRNLALETALSFDDKDLPALQAKLARFEQAQEIQRRRGWWAVPTRDDRWIARSPDDCLEPMYGPVESDYLAHHDPTTAIIEAEKWLQQQVRIS